MKNIERYIVKNIQADLRNKMVFIGGPRQVGKTTLAYQLLGKNNEGYLNWDIPENRERILKRQWPIEQLIVLDEIHKYRHWRNTIKGLYDQFRKTKKILVTGSARLDFYRFGGDSLQGRYHYWRLHPLSVAELGIKTTKDLLKLLNLGGFPEPFFRGAVREAKRWSREYRMRLFQEDLTSLEQVHDIGNIELLMLRLPALVGSPLSINSLREDIQVSHKTISKWLLILERLYAIFRLSPFGSAQVRAVKKEQKHYHFDWTLIDEQGLRFENLVACHLLKWVHYRQDAEGEDLELRYFRDIDGREVDFIVCKKGNPILAVECKWNDVPIGKGLKYLKERFAECEMWQISAIGKKDYISQEGIRVSPCLTLLRRLV